MDVAALVFDAYGALFHVHAVVRRCESFWPGKGLQRSQWWRAKQLEYTWQRSLMRRYASFSQVTREALARLRSRTAKLAILTNGPPDSILREVR